MSLPITPQTRIGAILAAYPQLEEVLLAYSPHFEKLRNPILRRTVARVATLQAAAVTAGVDVGELVRHLRAQVGQLEAVDTEAVDTKAKAAGVETSGSAGNARVPGEDRNAGDPTLPDWVESLHVAERLDVDELLNRNEHPLGLVKRLLGTLDAESMVELVGSFRPEPLIEALAGEGYRIHSRQKNDGVWTTVIARMENGGANHVDR